MYTDNTNLDSMYIVVQYIWHRGQARESSKGPSHVLWLGDFNSDNPMWDEAWNVHLFTRANLNRVQSIIDMLANYDLQMVLPKNLPALQALGSGNHTRPNSVFTTATLAAVVTSCSTMPGERPTRSDHFPIMTMIEVGPEIEEELTKHNFRVVDWQEV